MMLGGANPSMLSRGKSMFKDTFIGVLIVMLAWLITNTIIQSLADPTAIGLGGNWWSYTCVESNNNGGNSTVIISGEQVPSRTSSGATITWTTNVPATSQVSYGAVYGSNCQRIGFTPIDSNLSVSHVVTLSNLGSNATFCYNVISSNAANTYTAEGSVFQFQTLP